MHKHIIMHESIIKHLRIMHKLIVKLKRKYRSKLHENFDVK